MYFTNTSECIPSQRSISTVGVVVLYRPASLQYIKLIVLYSTIECTDVRGCVDVYKLFASRVNESTALGAPFFYLKNDVSFNDDVDPMCLSFCQGSKAAKEVKKTDTNIR